MIFHDKQKNSMMDNDERGKSFSVKGRNLEGDVKNVGWAAGYRCIATIGWQV